VGTARPQFCWRQAVATPTAVNLGRSSIIHAAAPCRDRRAAFTPLQLAPSQTRKIVQHLHWYEAEAGSSPRASAPPGGLAIIQPGVGRPHRPAPGNGICREATLEISQLRSGWFGSKIEFVLKARRKRTPQPPFVPFAAVFNFGGWRCFQAARPSSAASAGTVPVPGNFPPKELAACAFKRWRGARTNRQPNPAPGGKSSPQGERI
jgi:hypothetical protein